MRLTTGSRARLQVTQRVAGSRHVFQRNAEARADLLEQPRQGLAAQAVVVRAVRAVKNRVDAPADSRQHFVHLAVNGIERGHVKQPAPQPRLVGRDHDAPAAVIEPRNGFKRARQRYKLVGRFNEFVAVGVDGAVAVEDDEFHGVASRARRCVHCVMCARSCWVASSQPTRSSSKSSRTSWCLSRMRT